MVHDQDDQAAEYIESSHKRHESLGNFCDGLDSADDHKRDDNTENNRNNDRIDAEIGRNIGNNRISLYSTPDTECAQSCQT